MQHLSNEVQKALPTESAKSTAKQEKSQTKYESNKSDEEKIVPHDVTLVQLKRNLDKEGVCICEGLRWIGFNFPVGHQDFGQLTPCVCSDNTENRRTVLINASRMKEEKGFTDYWVSWNAGCSWGYEKSIEWSQGEGEPFVTLIGGTGVGKTHLAIASGWGVIGRGEPVLFYQVSDLMRDLQNGMSNGGFDRTLTQVKQCQNLILDDIGREYSTDWTLSILHELINYRYSNPQLRTLITTNHSLVSLRKILGEPAVSRLTDSYHGTLVVMDGKDVRPKLADLKNGTKQTVETNRT